MPKISVRERDLSWYFRQRGEGAATVYIPGLATFGPDREPVLCTSENFNNIFGTSSVDLTGFSERDYSYDIAASYIKAGFNVLFHRFIPSGATFSRATYKNLTINAKYAGSFGNNLSAVIRDVSATPQTTIYSVFVYLKGYLVETLKINLYDSTSLDYYENLESEYVSFTVEPASPEDGDPVSGPTTVKLQGGVDFEMDNNSASPLSQLRNSLTSKSSSGVYESLADLTDPYQYEFDLIDSCGLPAYSSSDTIDPVDQVLWDLASTRGTAVYFVNGKSTWDAATMYQYCGLFNTSTASYVAAYGPWGYAQFLHNGTTALLPGSYPMIVAWAKSCASGNPIWYAPAGVKRSSLGSFYKDTAYPVGKTVLDMWQNQDYIYPGSYKANPIMKVKRYGYVVYGNSTLLHSNSQGATSMLQSFSVRIMANLIKNQAFLVSLNLQFDQLTPDLFLEFKSLLGVFMDQLKYTNALYDYEIVLGNEAFTSIDYNEKTLPITIRISPNPAAENFDINLEISQAGVTFTDETDETEIV